MLSVRNARLTILRECRKRAAKEELPLRQIFDDAYRTSGASAQHLAFAEVESSVYKRHRVAIPILPSSPQSSDQAVSGSRFAQLGDSMCSTVVNSATPTTTPRCCSPAIVSYDLLRPAHLIYVGCTFRVVS